MFILSIIIPNYNNGRYLNRCLESILACDIEKYEVIVVDDGSTDDSLSILNTFKDNRLRIISQNNQGVSVARNNGIRNANGKYLIFADSDDYYEYKSIDMMLGYLENSMENKDLILFGANIRSGKHVKRWNEKAFLKVHKNPKIERYIYSLFTNYNGEYNSPCNKIYKTEIIKRNKIFFPAGIKTGEDGIFNIKYAMHCLTLGTIDESWYCYCMGESPNNSVCTSNVYEQMEQSKQKRMVKNELYKNMLQIIRFSQKECEKIQKAIDNQVAVGLYVYTNKLTIKQLKEVKLYVSHDTELCDAVTNINFRIPNIKKILQLVLVKIIFGQK